MSSAKPSLTDTAVLATMPGVPDATPTTTGQKASGEAFPDDALIGGRYRILNLLGAGAMGRVYRARDTELDEVVALKVLQRDLLSSPETVDRFRREVKLARLVTHRNVARTFDIGEHQGDKFLTMELIEGESLGRRLSRTGPLSVMDFLPIVSDVCAGLSAAHAAGVVHRDLKPDNVLLCHDGRVVITDFGIARGLADLSGTAKRTVGILGSPGYMAPEQIDESAPIDARTDLYALGCMMYELLTGELPWMASSVTAMLMARLIQPPPDPRSRRAGLPDTMAQVVMRCMARDPRERFAGAADVAATLSAATRPLTGVILAPHSGAETTQKGAALSPGPAAATASGKAVLPAGLGLHSRATTAGEQTLAVLPFRNGGPPEDAYLAEGLTEDLTDTLSMVQGLRVRPRGVVLATQVEGDPQQVGQALGVMSLVEGSVRRAGDMLRIQVRLIGVATGFQLWAQRFDRPTQDVFATSDEVAKAVTAALKVEQPAARADMPADPRVVDLYLQARHEYHKPDNVSVMRSTGLFEQALSLAPEDPVLLSGYAMARARMWFFGGEGSGDRAREAAAHAIQAAPQRGEPHLAQAMVRFQEGDLGTAVRDLRRAIMRSTVLAEAYDLLGRILIETGPLQDGIGALTTARALDPGLFQSEVAMARAHALLGDFVAADRILDAMDTQKEAGGVWALRARLAMWQRDIQRAKSYLQHPDMVGSRFPLVRMILMAVDTIGESGSQQVPQMPWIFSEHGSERNRSFQLQIRVELACVAGDREHALDLLRQAAMTPLYDLVWMDHCPLLEPLRADPRFPEVRQPVVLRAQQAQAAMRGTAS